MLTVEISGVMSPVEIIHVFEDASNDRVCRWNAIVRTFDTIPQTLEVPITERHYQRFLSIEH